MRLDFSTLSFKKIGILAGILICILIIIISFIRHPKPVEYRVGWKETFSGEPGAIPDGWKLMGKPGTPKSDFSIVREGGNSFLHMDSHKGSSSLVTSLEGVDLRETPLLRWKWRAGKLPEGADGRVKSRDDQAIAVYVGTGSMLSKKTISYRWDTVTPKGTAGKSVYGAGTIKDKWITLRNKQDAGSGWITEERNCAEDFKKAWGFYPEKVYISISCNSQYTASSARADLAWIELVDVKDKEEKTR
ncbi:MAG: DUF3047 domain-containing protein [Candidatus Omnitrophica bacterium]|nr:DUF3047 domain-containing protein [Candidatus Omnitrophota bacterium]